MAHDRAEVARRGGTAIEDAPPARRKKRRNKANRVKRSRRDGSTPFPWGMHYSSWCFNCRRSIDEYDLVVLGSYYDDEGKVEAFVHFDCREVSSRPRLPQPEASVHITAEGTRKLTMAAKTKTKTRKSRKQKAAEDAEEEMQSQTAASATEEDEDEDEEETTPAPKKSRKSKSKKAAAAVEEEDEEDEDSDEDEDSEDEEEETPKAKSKKGKGKGKAKAAKGEGASFAVTTGTRLVELLGEAPKKVRVIATNLSKGKDVSNEELVTLRDGIKEFAAKDRENGGKLSPQLSALNSRVRRLERSSR